MKYYNSGYYGNNYSHNYPRDNHRMGNSDSQLQEYKKKQATKTTLEQAMQMFRDQVGTILNVSERLLYSMGKIKDPRDFKFHGFSPERLVERDADHAAHKLLVLFKYLVSYYEDMYAEFPHDAKSIQQFPNKLETAFNTSAEEFMSIAAALGPEYALEKKLLQEILTRVVKGTYHALDPEFAAQLKSAIKARSGNGTPHNQDHSALIGTMHKVNQNMEDNAEYMRRNQGKQPTSAFEPATRVSSTESPHGVKYIGGQQNYYPATSYTPVNPKGEPAVTLRCEYCHYYLKDCSHVDAHRFDQAKNDQMNVGAPNGAHTNITHPAPGGDANNQVSPQDSTVTDTTARLPHESGSGRPGDLIKAHLDGTEGPAQQTCGNSANPNPNAMVDERSTATTTTNPTDSTTSDWYNFWSNRSK